MRHRKLQQFSVKWRVFLSVLWIWGAYHATDVIGTILPTEQMGGPALDKRLGAYASALVPLLVCFLTWLYIRLRNADRERAALPNIEGLVTDKAVFGIQRDRLGLIAVCIGIIIVDSTIFQYSPNVNVVQSREVNIPTGSPSYCLRSDGQIYQPANSLCYGIDRLVTP